MTVARERVLVSLLFVIVVPLELFAAKQAYETLSEITSQLLYLLTALNLPLLVLSWKRPLAAGLAAICLFLALVPRQLYLVDRLQRVQAEAARMVAYAYERQVLTGAFPRDLSGYRFHDPAMAPLIQGYEARGGGREFQLTYRVGTTSTSHWYSPSSGWRYSPD